MVGIMILAICVIAGILVGLNVMVPYAYSQYIAVAILACLDSVFGAFSANIEKKFKMNVFITGFFMNALVSIFLVYIGSKLDVDLYLGAIIVFTGRLLNNFTVIRRDALGKFDDNKGKFKLKVNKKIIDEIEEEKTNNSNILNKEKKKMKSIKK